MDQDVSPKPAAPVLSLEDVRAIFQLTNLLLSGERTVPELTQLLGRDEHQLRALLALLSEVNVPVQHPSAETYRVPADLPVFSAQEALATGLALRFFVQYASEPSPYLAALQRLASHWPATASAALLSRLNAAPQPQNPKFEQLAQAWLHGRALSFDYLHEGARPQQVGDTDLETLEIEPQNLSLELWASHREGEGASKLTRESGEESAAGNVSSGQAQLYRLSRMRRLKLGSRQRETGREVAVALAPRYATLRFHAQAAYRLLESRMSTMSEPEVQSDGTLLVSVQSSAGAHTEPRVLLGWILSWGAQVEVLSPPELREAWLSELRAALRLAQGAGPDHSCAASQ